MPHCYSTKQAIKFIPHLVKQPLRVLSVINSDEIKRRLSIKEHIYRFADMSAFNEKTIQDAKYHRFAHELYYVLEGKISVKWKHISDNNWKTGILSTDEEKRWIHIPPLHCIYIMNSKDEFLAVAFKSEESNKHNRNKVQGINCEIESCDERNDCINLQWERNKSFVTPQKEHPTTD